MSVRGGLAAGAVICIIAVGGSQGLIFAQQSSKTVRDGVYTQQQADRGKALVNEHCVACHGVTLGGSDSAPALVGGRFMSNWSGQSVGELAVRIRTTMPADDPGKLSSKTVADITAYLLASNGLPAGSAELPREATILGLIRIIPATEAKK